MGVLKSTMAHADRTRVSVPIVPRCPECRHDLVLTSDRNFDTWSCRDEHGIAVSTVEGAHRFQDDELELFLRGWTSGTLSERPCPTCEASMRTVGVAIDDDEDRSNNAGSDQSASQKIEAEVCRNCLILWFDQGEMDKLPANLPNATFEASPEQQKVLDNIRHEAVAVLNERYANEDANSFTERLLRKLRRR